MKKVRELFAKVAQSPELKKKFLFLLLIFLICRFLATVPVPGINVEVLQGFFADNQFLSILNLFSGGTLSQFSIIAMGVSPYISASIVIQLATIVLPKLKELQKEGERGKQKINQYTRLLSLPVALIQSVSMIVILVTNNLLYTNSIPMMIVIAIVMTAGAFLMTWLGELIGEYGIGNGVSMIMTLGIVSQLPATIGQIASGGSAWYMITAMIIVALALVALVTFFEQAIRQVPIQYAKRVHGSRTVGGQSTFLPIKLNSTGVLPIIFALTIMSVPSFVGQLLMPLTNYPKLQTLGANLTTWFASTSWIYIVVYFVIVFVFTYFSSVVLFNAEDIADELKKSGAFVPGIRPGEKTKNHLKGIVSNLTFINAIFLSLIALAPYLLGALTGVESLAIGGTSVLILVSVIMETAKQVEGQTVGQNYDKYN